MAHSIEAFVKQLREEGVEAGRSEAEQLVTAAQEQAKTIVAEAQAEAERLTAQARSEAEQTAQKAQADLDLAVRDTIARLREQISGILSGLLARRSEAVLNTPEILAQAVAAIIQQYREAAHQGQLEIQVPPAVQEQVQQLALAGIGEAVAEGKLRESLIRGTQSQPGFSYRVEGATVEVDAASIVAHLKDMVNPALRAALARQEEAGA